ncbi:MAG: DUF2062 domain-containing protein [Proteobacteria bacterium]|nr:DUF2062 domain-containing protein [Pseudomonadota bacterium]
MKRFFQIIFNKINQHIIKPIIESVSPINEAALGTAIGVFVGLTPTVGIQMWIVFMVWLVCKHILKIKFDLIIGTAIVWISNPFTMPFLYYGFLATGYACFSMVGSNSSQLDFASFHSQFTQILNSSENSNTDIIVESLEFLLRDLGYPMILGSLVYAIPFALLSYSVVRKYLRLYRINNARKMGIDYDTWREKYERK